MIAVIDNRMPCSAKAELKKRFDIIELPPFERLDRAVASHPDMLMFRLFERLFVCKDYYEYASDAIDRIIACSALELFLTDDKLSAPYPKDVAFNLFKLGDSLYGNEKAASTEVKRIAKESGLAFTSLKQGYAKCSSVVLDDAVISADVGICEAVRKSGKDALLITPGGVSLDRYEYGFIGGASGVCGKEIYFCGDITKHRDYDKIQEFCALHRYTSISLSSEPLYDVGSILFFE